MAADRVDRGGDGRGGLYLLMGIIIALIVVALVLFLPRADDGTRDIDADIRIEVPDAPDPSPGQGGTPPDGGGGAGGNGGDGGGGEGVG